MQKYLVIKASAGSGKTYRVTHMLIDMIKNGEILPSEIIATTFTNKAAAELSQRIRETLVNSSMEEEASALGGSLIGTVNSVAGRIVKDFALEKGLSPGLQVLEENQQKRVFKEAVDDVILAAQSKNRDLLFRVSYDLAEGQDPYNTRKEKVFKDAVAEVVHLARSNSVSVHDFERFKESSLNLLEELLGPGNLSDVRQKMMDAVRNTITVLEQKLKNEEINKRSINSVTNWVIAAKKFARNSITEISWKDWITLEEEKKIGGKSAAPARDVFEEELNTGASVLQEKAFKEDLSSLIRLVFDTAEEALSVYKTFKEQNGLIDFVDQETLAYEILADIDVQQQIRERYRVLAVDEFQDTSPVQLALFMRLGSLVEKIVWVGDTKQAIYGFRDADAALMTSAVQAVAGEDSESETLQESWRTHKTPLDFSNELFARVFEHENVRLGIPEQKAEDHAGGELLLWQGENAKSQKEWQKLIVAGIKSLREKDQNPNHSYAVLTRTNGEANKIQNELEAQGIDCARAGTPLMQTRTGRLIVAALKFIIDESDTKSLIEMITLLPEHHAHSDWLMQLSEQCGPDEQRALLEVWMAAEPLKHLVQLRVTHSSKNVAELVAELCDIFDLRHRVIEWGRQGSETAALRGVLLGAKTYMDERDFAGSVTSTEGLIEFLQDDRKAFAAAKPEPGAIFVDTVYKAKGLEWDTVVAALPKASDKFKPCGAWVEAPNEFEIENPLHGRDLRYLPQTLLMSKVLEKTARDLPEQLIRFNKEAEEKSRLLYVALTRSKQRTVLCPENSFAEIDAFADTDVKAKIAEDGQLEVTNTDGVFEPVLEAPKVQIETFAIGEDAFEKHRDATAGTIWAARLNGEVPETDFLPATIQPSAAQLDSETAAGVKIDLAADLGPRITLAVGDSGVAGDSGAADLDMEFIGECVHAYLASSYYLLPEEEKLQLAEELIRNWMVSKNLTAKDVVEMGERWRGWLTGNFPEAKFATEVPFTWVNSHGQRMQGWIDQLVTMRGGEMVVVDHKSFPGASPERKIREDFLGQLQTYKDALEDITDKRVSQVLVHLPTLGKVYSVSL